MGRKPKGSSKERREPAHKIDGDGMELQSTASEWMFSNTPTVLPTNPVLVCSISKSHPGDET